MSTASSTRGSSAVRYRAGAAASSNRTSRAQRRLRLTCQPKQRVPSCRVRDAILPGQHARQQQHADSQHGRSHGLHVQPAAKHLRGQRWQGASGFAERKRNKCMLARPASLTHRLTATATAPIMMISSRDSGPSSRNRAAARAGASGVSRTVGGHSQYSSAGVITMPAATAAQHGCKHSWLQPGTHASRSR